MKKVPSIKELKKKYGHLGQSWIARRYRRISFYFTKAFLYTSITPNQISGISMLIGLVGGFLYTIGEYWSFILGTVCYIFYSILDRSDGTVAKYKKMKSFKGKYLEFIGCHYIYLFIYAGLVWGVYRNLGDSLVILSGLLLILFNVLIKHTINGYHIALLSNTIEKNKPLKIDLTDHKKFFPKKLRNLGWEINAFIFDSDYLIFWIAVLATLDLFMPKITIYSFNMNYLILLILLHLFGGFLKLIATIMLYLISDEKFKN